MTKKRFFKPYQIFLLDTGLSWTASFIVILIFVFVAYSFAAILDFIREWVVVSLISTILANLIAGVYKSAVRYSTSSDFIRGGAFCILKEALLWWGMALWTVFEWDSGLLIAMVALDFFATLSILLLFKILMITIYEKLNTRAKLKKYRNSLKNVLIYGNSEKSVAILSRLKNSPHYNVKGFIMPQQSVAIKKISDKPVYFFSDREKLEAITDEAGIAGILFPTTADAREERNRLLAMCRQLGLKTYITPEIDEIGDNPGFPSVRKIKIEDLLGREEIKISPDEVAAFVEGKTIMVTGGAGSIGSELCRQLAAFRIKELVIFDNAETPLHNIRLELEEKFPDMKSTPVIGDVRSKARLDFVFSRHRPDIVFHAAAYKHVPLMEENPCEAVLVNVEGTQNVADKCIEYDVERMVMVSTDKAVNPTNVMGCSKRLAEIYVQSLGLAIKAGEIESNTVFVTTRFGNVLGSNGSVIPRFRHQIENGGPVTVTHPEINRFFMTIPEACRLVMEAAAFASEPQIFVFDMGAPVKIADLAHRMVELAGLTVGKDIEIKYTGLRPGEKLYEEVLATKENTSPTHHDRIFIAGVREYPFKEAAEIMKHISILASEWKITEMIKAMKRAVPEYISQNSQFQTFDLKDA